MIDMRFRFTAIAGAGVLCAGLLAPSTVASASSSAAPGNIGGIGKVAILEDTPARLTARFETSTSTTAIAAQKPRPTRDVVSVTVSGMTLTADRDLATGTATWGAGGQALGPREKLALGALLTATSAWRSSATSGELGGMKDLTLRLIMLASEAPEGVVIPMQSVNRPSERRLEKQAGALKVVADSSATKADSCAADVVAVTAAGTEARVQALAACQQSNEDGILYFGSCSTINRWLMHDAANHCMVGESISAGPASTSCMGECGPGCQGLNIYTYDCGDHDRCGRVHGGSTNPWDSECGDEYFEADDDFLWGWPNC
jgi:hypothetical protein